MTLMKRDSLKSVFVAALAVVSPIVILPVLASSESPTALVEKAIKGVPAPELAATAAKLVSQAKADDKESVALTTVQVIVSKYPATARTVVASIAKTAPKLAAKVAAKAAEITPDQSVDLAYVAALAARGYAVEVAEAVAKVTPAMTTRINEMVAVAVPETPMLTAEVASEDTAMVAASPVIERGARASGGTTPPSAFPKKKVPSKSVSGFEKPGADYDRP